MQNVSSEKEYFCQNQETEVKTTLKFKRYGITVQKRAYSNEERHKDDFYATSYETTEYLLQFETFHHRVIEPAYGEGHISKVLIQAGYDVQSFDLFDRGYGLCGLDFLKDEIFDKFKSQADFIFNPPYSLAMEFISRALK